MTLRSWHICGALQVLSNIYRFSFVFSTSGSTPASRVGVNKPLVQYHLFKGHTGFHGIGQRAYKRV